MAQRVAVITGASAGIGAAIAKQLVAKGGYAVVLSARRGPELSAVVDALPPGTALGVQGDMTKREDVERLLSAALAHFGRVDVWVNNVGRGISKPVLELTDGEVEEVLSVNLHSALYGMQVAGKHMKGAGSGHILNISSFLAKVPAAPFRSIYSASKAALNSLTSNLRMDLAGTGVYATTVMPGVVYTDFARNAINGTPGVPAAAPAPAPAGGAAPAPAPGPGTGWRGQTADEAAAPIVAAIEASANGGIPPVEVFTQGQGQKDMYMRYAQDPGAVEAGVGGRSPAGAAADPTSAAKARLEAAKTAVAAAELELANARKDYAWATREQAPQ